MQTFESGLSREGLQSKQDLRTGRLMNQHAEVSNQNIKGGAMTADIGRHLCGLDDVTFGSVQVSKAVI